MFEVQVKKSHYEFSKYYMSKNEHWLSLWHQVEEVLSLNPNTVLEVGGGGGVFKAITRNYGLTVEIVDIDPDLKPDHVASATSLPFQDNAYDCTCAFQVLEHLPYKESIKAFSELVRVSKNNVVISLPDAKPLWFYSVYIPKIGRIYFNIQRPQKPRVHKFDGEHYWEINKKDYPLKKIIDDLLVHDVKILKTYRVKEYSYHRFFVFEKYK